MSNQISRRDAFMCLATAAGAIATVGVAKTTKAAAAAKPHVAVNDPTAVALGYIEDATKVDAKKNPMYKAGSTCANCLQSTGGAATDAWRPCNLFPNKLVDSKGWCKVYIKKP
jgi:hypothetical protein